MAALDADVRLNRWTLSLAVEGEAMATALGAGVGLSDLAASVLAPGLAALDPGGEEILVIDRLVLPPLQLQASGNGPALARFAQDIVVAAQTATMQEAGSRHQRLSGEAAVLGQFARALVDADASRLWLWRALGLLGPDDGTEAMARRLIDRLEQGGARSMPHIWRILAQVPVRALWQRLGDEDLLRLARLASREAGAGGAAQWMQSVGAGGSEVGARKDSVELRQAAARPEYGSALARAWLSAAGPVFVDLAGQASAVRAQATAVIALALSGGMALPEARRERLLTSAVALFTRESFGQDRSGIMPQQGTVVAPPQRAAEARKSGLRPGPDAADGKRAARRLTGLQRSGPTGAQDVPMELATGRAGLLFLLALLPEAGLLDGPARSLFAAGGLAGRLVALGHLGLGVGLDDPALRAFAGLWPGRIPGDDLASRPLPAPKVTRASLREVARLQDGLTAALGRRPAAELDLAAIVARRGWLRFAPAEIDLHLPMADVDIGIRRAGLDASPGFLPWLGCVVRVHYDES